MLNFKSFTMKKIISIFAFALTFTCYGQVDSEYKNTLKKMFEVSGTEESYKALFPNVLHFHPSPKTK